MRSVSYMVVFYGIEDFMSPRFSPVIMASLSMARTAAPPLSILLKSSKPRKALDSPNAAALS